MTIISLSIARPAVQTATGEIVPSVVAVAGPYMPRGPIIAGTSSTSNTLVNTGTVSFIMNEPSLEFHEGARMRSSVVGAPSIWMEGLVDAWVPSTRLLTLGIDLSSGLGTTFANWSLNVAGQPGAAGPSGPTGPSGGPTGPTGPTGIQGPPGINGVTGASGPTGPSGTPGTPGGASGPTGPSGVTGASGVSGPTGASGAVGSAGGEAMSNGMLSVTASGGSLTVSVLTLAGTNPSGANPVVFRIPDPAGTYTVLSVTSALSLTVPSGCTLGVNIGSAFRLWVVAINDGGTVRLGIGRMSSEFTPNYIWPLADNAAGRSTTLLNTSSNLPGLYSNPAVVLKPYRVLGYIEWNTAGLAVSATWTITNLRCVQLMGLGVRLPGQIIQAIQVTDLNTYVNTGTAAVAAITYAGFTCFDSCNPIRVTAQGIMWPAPTVAAVARIYRGNSSTPIGGEMEVYSDTSNTIASGEMKGVDFPNISSAAPVNILVMFFSTAAGVTLRWNPTGLPLVMLIEELMG